MAENGQRRRESLSLRQARRLAIAAQGLHRPRRPVAADRRHLRQILRHTGLLQIDSVNVLQRAHYLPAFSRIGAYPTSLLDRMAYRDHELFEYWGHEASLLPVELHPLLRWGCAVPRRSSRRGGGWRSSRVSSPATSSTSSTSSATRGR